MTAAKLAALGLRVKPLEFGSDQLVFSPNGNMYQLCRTHGEYWVIFTKRLARRGECEVIEGPNRTEAEAIAACNAHHAAQFAAMIERTK